MGYREDTFRRRFESTAKIFGAKPLQVISIKLREGVPTSDYKEFFKILEYEMGLNCLDIHVELHEDSHLISNHKGKVILVEHETGLEILYLVGSTASIITLIPLLIQGWRFLRNHHWGRHSGYLQSIEIRHFDEKWNLHEEHIPDFEMNNITSIGLINPTITHLLDTEMNQVFSKIDSLNNRVEKLEKMLKAKPSKTKEKTTTNKTTKSKNIKRV